MNGQLLTIVGVITAVVFIGFIISIYNSLITKKNQTKNAWAQIEVQLKRRYDLIPNLMETVKGYMEHERATLEAVVKARQIAMGTQSDAKTQANAENILSGTLKTLFAVAENYPDLKANQNFLALQEELTTTENKISFARQFYNDCVMQYNNAKEVFPNNIIVEMFRFEDFSMFEIEDSVQRQAPKVQF